MNDNRTSLATSEPAVVTGGIIGAFGAVITALSAFGLVHFSPEQLAALAGAVAIVVPLIQGLITRQFVRPAKLSVPAPGTGADIVPPTTPPPSA